MLSRRRRLMFRASAPAKLIRNRRVSARPTAQAYGRLRFVLADLRTVQLWQSCLNGHNSDHVEETHAKTRIRCSPMSLSWRLRDPTAVHQHGRWSHRWGGGWRSGRSCRRCRGRSGGRCARRRRGRGSGGQSAPARRKAALVHQPWSGPAMTVGLARHHNQVFGRSPSLGREKGPFLDLTEACRISAKARQADLRLLRTTLHFDPVRTFRCPSHLSAEAL